MAGIPTQSIYRKGSNNPKHPLYVIWRAMKQRCYDPSYIRFHRYGGRGIEVCDRWLTFELFVKDMLPTYQKRLSLDRIDNDRNYAPENCRWATSKEQARNTSQNVFYEHKGLRLTMGQWAEKTGIKRKTLVQRFHAYKWSLEKTLTTAKGDYRGRRA